MNERGRMCALSHRYFWSFRANFPGGAIDPLAARSVNGWMRISIGQDHQRSFALFTHGAPEIIESFPLDPCSRVITLFRDLSRFHSLAHLGEAAAPPLSQLFFFSRGCVIDNQRTCRRRRHCSFVPLSFRGEQILPGEARGKRRPLIVRSRALFLLLLA